VNAQFDAMVADMDEALFSELGGTVTLTRAAAAPVPVQVVLTRGVAIMGEYGQIVARVTTATFRNSEWMPAPGDVLNFATGARKVDSITDDDGYVTTAVLHG